MNKWKFGDVVEWDIAVSGPIRWFIIGPQKYGVGYQAIWMSGGAAKWEYTDRRITDIMSSPESKTEHRLVSDG